MVRRPSLRSELQGLYDEAGVDGLREVLADEADDFAQRLGVAPAEIAAVVTLDDEALTRALAGLVDRVEPVRDRAARAADLERQADAAAADLASRARYHDGRVELDRLLLLGPLLADADKKILTFDLGHAEVSVARRKLMAVKQATRAFSDLAVGVDPQALRFRWRGGRGGLNLRPLLVRPHDRVLERRVVLVPPSAVHTPVVPAPPQPSSSWLHDLFAELAALP